MKIDKSNLGWLFACIGLVLLLGLSIYLGKSGFFFATENNFATDLKLGQNLECGIDKNQSNSISINFSGGFLPEERLPQVVAVKNLSDSVQLFLRAKVFAFTSQNQFVEIDIVENSNWIKNEDGYFYYNSLLSPQEKSTLASFVILPNENVSFLSNKKYILTFVFESLDSSVDVKAFWGYNPIENI